MAGADMKYTISADLNSAIKQTAVLTGELNGLDKASVKAGISISKLSNATSGIKVDELNQGLSAISSQLPTIGNQALDAGDGLSALASGDLIGGIAIVTTYLVGMAEELFAAATRSSALTEATDTLNKTLLNSTASVAGNVASLQSLVKVAQDVTLSDAARSEAINKLNKDYDSFNGKLNLANINTQESIGLINSQTDALVKQAEIKALTNLITKEAEYRDELAATGVQTTKLQDVSNGLLSFFSFNAAVISETKDKVQNYKDEIVRSTTKTNIYTSALDNLFKSLAKSGDLFKEKTVQQKALKLKVNKVKIDATEIAFVSGKVNFDDIFQSEGGIGFDASKLKFDPTTIFPQPITPLKIPVELILAEKAKLKLEEDIKNAKKAIADGVANSFQSLYADMLGGIGEAIGAIASGADSFVGVFKGILSSVGDFVIKLGKAAIQTAIIAKFLKQPFKNPVVGIAAGIAAIALGTIIKAATSSTGFADGGYVSGPGSSRSDSIPARLSNGEYVLQASAVRSLGRGFLDTLNTGNLPQFAMGGPSSNGASIGGGQNLVLSGETITRGQDLLTVWRRASQTYSRIS